MGDLRCPTHPSYKASFPPKVADCITCWAAYGRRRAYADGLRSQGRARGGGQSSKAKGRGFMVTVADRLREVFGLSETDIFVKATSQGGCDLHLASRAVEMFPYSVEGKNQEKLNIWAALVQAEANATPERPAVVFFKRAKSTVYVALKADEFLRLLCRDQKPSSS